MLGGMGWKGGEKHANLAHVKARLWSECFLAPIRHVTRLKRDRELTFSPSSVDNYYQLVYLVFSWAI
jgi:hypothetical protein